MRKLTIILFLLIIVLTACNQDTRQNKANYVAIVNGEEISANEFNKELEFTMNNLLTQGYSLDEEQLSFLEEEVLDRLIKDKVIIQYANEKNYEITDTEISATYQMYVNEFQGEENLLEALAYQNLSKEEFYDEIENQLIIDSFIKDYIEENGLEFSLEVTEEEIINEFELFKETSGIVEVQLEDYYTAIQYILEEEKLLSVIDLITSRLLENSEIIYND
jgi:peptidyl-prolyl cis-trans isomerase C